MNGVTVSATVDVSGLRRAIPEIVAFGTRTMREQCVTSAGWICVNAQKETRAVEVGRIDEELSVEVTPVLSTRGKRKGLPLMSGKTNISVPKRGLASMIAVARMHPNSKYSRITGNRWPVPLPSTKGTAEFWLAIQAIAQRMVKSRHSSTHFLQAGWKSPIRKSFSSPFFRHSRKYRNAESAMASAANPRNTLDSGRLGGMAIELAGDACVVIAQNDVGEGGNAVLDAKHRTALIRYGLPPLQAAVDMETASINREIERRFDDGLRQVPFAKRL